MKPEHLLMTAYDSILSFNTKYCHKQSSGDVLKSCSFPKKTSVVGLSFSRDKC